VKKITAESICGSFRNGQAPSKPILRVERYLQHSSVSWPFSILSICSLRQSPGNAFQAHWTVCAGRACISLQSIGCIAFPGYKSNHVIFLLGLHCLPRLLMCYRILVIWTLPASHSFPTTHLLANGPFAVSQVKMLPFSLITLIPCWKALVHILQLFLLSLYRSLLTRYHLREIVTHLK
jgi:hypothetical protein